MDKLDKYDIIIGIPIGIVAWSMALSLVAAIVSVVFCFIKENLL